MYLNVTEYNIRCDSNRLQLSMSIKVISPIFTLVVTDSDFPLTFQVVDLEHLGQCRRVEHSHRCHAVANTNLYKSPAGHRVSYRRF